MKPKVYLETTIISYMAARSSRDLIVAAHQQMTRDWFDRMAPRHDLYISDLVLAEVVEGDKAAASRRKDVVKGMRILAVDAESLELAAELVGAGCIPTKASADAAHVAVAAVNGLD